jgi:hypothetical protein
VATALVTIQLPAEIYQRLERTASRLGKPVETVLAETLHAALPVEDNIPEGIRHEIARLDGIETHELRQIAQSEMTDTDQQALEQLLDLQNMRPLTGEESAQLDALRVEYGRVLLRKARAFSILAERGQPVSLS